MQFVETGEISTNRRISDPITSLKGMFMRRSKPLLLLLAKTTSGVDFRDGCVLWKRAISLLIAPSMVGGAQGCLVVSIATSHSSRASHKKSLK